MTRVAPAVVPATGSADPRNGGGAGAGARTGAGPGEDGRGDAGIVATVDATVVLGGTVVLVLTIPGLLTALDGDPVGVREGLGPGVSAADPEAGATPVVRSLGRPSLDGLVAVETLGRGAAEGALTAWLMATASAAQPATASAAAADETTRPTDMRPVCHVRQVRQK